MHYEQFFEGRFGETSVSAATYIGLVRPTPDFYIAIQFLDPSFYAGMYRLSLTVQTKFHALYLARNSVMWHKNYKAFLGFRTLQSDVFS